MQELALRVTGKIFLNRRKNANYYVDQIQDLNIQTNQLQAKSHQIEVARVGFVSLLKAELEAQERIFAGGEDEDGSEEAPAEEVPAE